MPRPAGLASDLLTFDDFCDRVADDQKADLIDEVISLASPDSRKSNRLTTLIASLLEQYVSARGVGGEAFVNRFAFQLDETSGLEPDVAWVAQHRLHLVGEGRMFGGPDVAVEVVSRDSRQRDWVEKRQKYEAAGVDEYWIIDPIQRRVEFLRLAGGRDDVVPLEENRIFRSAAIPGFWLDIDWLLGAQLPNAYESLQQLLAG